MSPRAIRLLALLLLVLTGAWALKAWLDPQRVESLAPEGGVENVKSGSAN